MGISAWPFWRRSLFLILWDTSYLPLHTIRDAIIRFPKIKTFAKSQRNASVTGDALRGTIRSLDPKGRIRREEQIKSVNIIAANGLRMLSDPDLNMVMIHLPVPHPEGIWSSGSQRFSAAMPSDYIDNLALADHLLGRIRGALETTGDWENVSILVSADHPFRVELWRADPSWNSEMETLTRAKSLRYVPFLLKLPKRHPPVTLNCPFNSVVSAKLILRILNRQIAEPDQAIDFLCE
jgi:hypothetical protein